MKGENRRAMKWSHLHPRTSTNPIGLAEYLARQERSMVIDADRLNPDFVQWVERMRNEPRYRSDEPVVSHRDTTT